VQKFMKRTLILTVLSCFLSFANAGGDAEAGKALTGLCLACHGQDGNSLVGAFPNIAGQTSQYLLKQMLEIKSGARPVPVMTGMLDAMSETDLKNIAAFYESQPAAAGAADPDLVELGETIYRAGVARKGIAACSACHSPTGNGNGPAGFPAVAGQWPEYTTQQLKAFRSGDRHNDGDAEMMRTTAEDMSDKEIAAVSSYLHGLR
jgi:cytochrome c553